MIDETALTNELAQAGEHNAGIETRRHRRETALETIAAKREEADSIEAALPDNIAAIELECHGRVDDLQQQIAQLQVRIGHAQYEIRVYADAMRELAMTIAPTAIAAWESA